MTRPVLIMIGKGAILLLKSGVSWMEDQRVAAPRPLVTAPASTGRESLTRWYARMRPSEAHTHKLMLQREES